MGFSLNNNLSSEDRDRMAQNENSGPNQFGFDSVSEDDDFFGNSDSDKDDMDLEALFNGGSNDNDPFGSGIQSGGFGQSAGGLGGFGVQQPGGFGQPAGFGQPGGLGGFGGLGGQQVQPQANQPDVMDKLIEASVDTATTIWEIFGEVFQSIKLKNADDFGNYGTNLLKFAGPICIVLGILSGILGFTLKIKFLSFSGLGLQLILAGLLTVFTGLTFIGVAACILIKLGESEDLDENNIPDIPNCEDNLTNQYEENSEDLFNDLFSGFDQFDLGSEEEDNTNSDEMDDFIENFDKEEGLFAPDLTQTEEIDFASELEKIEENKIINRTTLFNTFKSLFRTCTPNFSDKKEIESYTDEFKNLHLMCRKVLANLSNCELEEVDSSLDEAYESFFSYELKLRRINKLKNTEAIAREVEIYTRESSDDDSVNATVTIEGDYYKIIITKGVSAIVTFGDIFRQQYCCDFFLDEKKKLPMIVGIDELGKVILDDAKNFDTMLIAGKPRSGKSWYVLSILASLMLFNSPENVQFVIVDPKQSNLFKTLSLLPHVCGLHDDTYILKILDDIIEVESPRRKKILNDHKCDDIWALWEKGVKLPVLYVVIDEYITVINNLEKEDKKEFDGKIMTLISQLPSQGIRLIFVPHRSTGIVSKTNRTMLQFTAAVRADSEDVKETLGLAKAWTRSLTKQGDIAVKTSSMKNAIFIRGAALSTSDANNTEFIDTAAKAFYKMGVDLPDMTNMRVACNRDEEYIRQELVGENRIQYNANTIFDEDNNLFAGMNDF